MFLSAATLNFERRKTNEIKRGNNGKGILIEKKSIYSYWKIMKYSPSESTLKMVRWF